MEESRNISLTYSESTSIGDFRSEFLQQLDHGYLDYNFVQSYKVPFLNMLREDLKNYKSNKFCKSAEMKTAIIEEALASIAGELDFKKILNIYIEHMREVVNRDKKESFLFAGFYSMIAEIMEEHNC